MNITSKLMSLCEIYQTFTILNTFFYISQGSVATYVRCGFIENYLMNLIMKELLKSTEHAQIVNCSSAANDNHALTGRPTHSNSVYETVE